MTPTRMEDDPGGRRLWHGGIRRRGRSRHSQHLPHPREGGGKSLFRTGQDPRHEARRAKRRWQDMVIAVAGCVAQAEGEEIARRAKGVDLVFGPQTFHRLPDYLARHKETGRTIVETEFPASEKFGSLAGRKSAGQAWQPFSPCRKAATSSAASAWCPIRAVRSSRGPWRRCWPKPATWPPTGVREVTLLGQNVNAYRGDDGAAARQASPALVAELSLITGIDRIRYTTSHPRDMSADLIEAHASNAQADAVSASCRCRRAATASSRP